MGWLALFKGSFRAIVDAVSSIAKALVAILERKKVTDARKEERYKDQWDRDYREAVARGDVDNINRLLDDRRSRMRGDAESGVPQRGSQDREPQDG